MDCKPCHIVLSNVESSPSNLSKNNVAGHVTSSSFDPFRKFLNKWKDGRRAKAIANSSGETDDVDLEPVQLLSDRSGHSINISQKPSSIDLSTLLTDFKTRLPKVEIRVDEAISSAADEAENEDFRNRMRQENEFGRGKIKRTAPGIIWLGASQLDNNLSSLPLWGSCEPCDTDRRVLDLLNCPFKSVYLTRNFTILCQLVQRKHNLLNNMFLAMCYHSHAATVQALHKCLHTILTSNYTGVDAELDSWTPRADDILSAINCLGATETYTECTDDVTDTVANQRGSYAHLGNLKALLNIITCSCKSRKSFSIDEMMKLIQMVAKLSLDNKLICRGMMSYFHKSIDALLSVPDDNCFSDLEPEICKQLLSLVIHHHNRLHIVKVIPLLSERGVDLRMTLAYSTICQLISEDNDISDCIPIHWTMNNLAHKYFTLEINDSVDMYQLYTLISLFDIAIGGRVDVAEKEDADTMKQEICKQCRQLKENPMRPDITKTKYFMHRVSMRWEWLVQQATPIEEVLDIKYKPTPTKIIHVDSQEIRPGSSDEEDYAEDRRGVKQMDVTSNATDSSSDERLTDSEKRQLNTSDNEVAGEQLSDSFSRQTFLSAHRSLDRLKERSTPSPTFSPSGLERLRIVARELCGLSPSKGRSDSPFQTSRTESPLNGCKPPYNSPQVNSQTTEPLQDSIPLLFTRSTVTKALTFTVPSNGLEDTREPVSSTPVGRTALPVTSGSQQSVSAASDMDTEEYLPDLD